MVIVNYGKAGLVLSDTYHEAQVPPLMEEVTVDIEAVWLRKVLGDELPDGRQILFLLAHLILDIEEVLEPLIVTHPEVVDAKLGRQYESGRWCEYGAWAVMQGIKLRDDVPWSCARM